MRFRMVLQSDDEGITSVNWGQRIAESAVGATIMLIGISILTLGDQAWGIPYLLSGAALLALGLRSCEVRVEEHQVVTRAFLATRRYPYESLRSAEVGIGQTGIVGQRKYLLLRLKDGSSAAFVHLNARVASSDETVVERAVRSINARIRWHNQ